MKNKLLKSGTGLLMVFMATVAFGQTIKEGVSPLSKKAQKGFVEKTTFNENGNVNVLYKIGGDKKKNELFFESYAFDNGLKFLETKSANEPKIESRPDKEESFLRAYVGGSNSFDVLSMKLKVNMIKRTRKWDAKNQRYYTDKIISDETIKLKTEDERSYYGVDSYRGEDRNEIVVLAYYEKNDKEKSKQYVLLTIDFEGGLKEKNLDATGDYSMVYCQEISESTPGKSVGQQDFIVVLAPKKGTGSPTNYLYLHYDITGKLKNKVEFASPSSNLLVNSIDVKNGEVFLSALSTKSKDTYDKVFNDYAIIPSPGFNGDGNAQYFKFLKAASEEMDFFHMLKFSGNKMVFASTASVEDFKAKKKTAPGEKGGKIYKGTKFKILNFEVTPANEYLIAGQLTSRNNIGVVYGDVVCFHFDAQGKLKAQYAIDKIFEDKPSEIFDMPQSFYVSGDGKYAYWQILEVKGFTGYANFSDAYNGVKTFSPKYFPRITKIDLQAATLTEFKIPGNKKYFVYNDGIFFNPETLTATFVGRDEDHENLWVSKVVFD